MKEVKEVDDKKLHAGMLEAAEKAVAGKGDGRISEKDAHEIVKHLNNDKDGLGAKTLTHIHKNFNLTESAKTVLASSLVTADATESVQTAPGYPNNNVIMCKEGDIFVIVNEVDNGSHHTPPADIGSQLVLNCRGDGSGNHTPIQAWAAGGGVVNQWMLFANPEKPKEYGFTKWWHLVNMNSGKFLDINTGNGTPELYDAIDGDLESVDRDIATWNICAESYSGFGKGNSCSPVAILNCDYNNFLSLEYSNAATVDLESWKNLTGQLWAFYWLSNQKSQPDTPEHHKVGLPSLTNNEPVGGTTTEVKSAGYALIPFYRCEDPGKSASWRAQNSPFYKLYRDTYWKCVTWGNNPTSIVQKPSFTTEEQTGYSDTEQKTFSESVGVTVGVSVGEPGASFSAEVSLQVGFSETSSFTNSFSYTKIRSFPLSISPLTSGSVWVLVNRYTLKRNNGEVVSTHEVNDGYNIAYAQYPKPENFTAEDAVYREGMNDPS